MEDLELNIPTDVQKSEDRLNFLINFSKKQSVQVDSNIAPLRYYYYGLEILQTANSYYRDDKLEKSYLLYLKFLNLFSEEISKHPDFETDLKEKKVHIQAKLKEVLHRTDVLKERLLAQYEQEYNSYFAENFISSKNSSDPNFEEEIKSDQWSPVSKYIVHRRLGLLE